MNATLVEAGFYRGNGKWRLRKMTRHPINQTPEDGLAPEWALPSLLRRAERGYLTALPGLQRFLEEDAGMWRTLEKHALQTEEVLFGMVAASRPDLAKQMKKHSAAMKAEISHPHPTRLVSLLVQRAVLMRLQACILDALLPEHQAKDGSLAHEQYLRSRRDQAHRRYSLVQKRLDLLRELLPSSRESVRESKVQPAPLAPVDLIRTEEQGTTGES